MTRREAIRYVRNCGENDGPGSDHEQLRELFVALYGREPDQHDWNSDVWSLCCAAVS